MTKWNPKSKKKCCQTHSGLRPPWRSPIAGMEAQLCDSGLFPPQRLSPSFLAEVAHLMPLHHPDHKRKAPYLAIPSLPGPSSSPHVSGKSCLCQQPLLGHLQQTQAVSSGWVFFLNYQLYRFIYVYFEMNSCKQLSPVLARQCMGRMLHLNCCILVKFVLFVQTLHLI